MARVLAVLSAAGVAMAGAGTARADLVITPLLTSGANSFIDPTVNPNVTVLLSVSSNAGANVDQFNSAILRVRFSQAGVVLNSVSWGAPFVNDLPWNDSTPGVSLLPLAIVPGTYVEPVADIGDSDIQLSNVVPTPSGRFTTGVLATLSLTIPVSVPAGQLLIEVVPDTVASGFNEITTTGGPRLLLVIVPAPGASCALALAGVVALRRRR
jgi:hypothetical protein